MENRADTMVKDSICPLQHPIIMPEPAQIDQHSLHEMVDQTAQNLTVENTCQNQQENENQTDLGNHEHENDQTNLNFSLDIEPTTEEKYKKIEEEILNVIEEIKRIPIEKRPVLIKLQENHKFKTLLEEVNSVFRNMEIHDLDLNELNEYHYGTALYIQRQLAPWNNESKKHRNGNKSIIPHGKEKSTR